MTHEFPQLVSLIAFQVFVPVRPLAIPTAAGQTTFFNFFQLLSTPDS
jgi:hypothetical protein